MKKRPKIAVIGKPNAGKSTLVNRLCSDSEAIVHHAPMITRDRKYYRTDWEGIDFYLLDTGGIDTGSREKLAGQILKQAKKAIEESDIVVFLVDIKTPLSVIDEEIADILRKAEKPLIFTGNKWDNPEGSYYTEDYLKLGMGYPIVISATHGLNITELLDAISSRIKGLEIHKHEEFRERTDEESEVKIPCVAILGQPNVGKSTLFNSIIREERVIVDEIEGTTRDSIDSIITIDSRHYKFIDTAGMKKDKLNQEDLEFYSRLRTLKSIEKSDICLVLIDCTRDVTGQDKKIIETVLKKGASACVLFNKTDLAEREKLDRLIHDFGMKLEYAGFIPFLKISALKDRNNEEIFKMIDFLLEERNKRISDNRLTQLFKDLENESALYSEGKKFKIKFMRQTGQSPPRFLVFSNMDIKNKANIIRYIENSLRKEFGFNGTPVFFKFRY
ncbi:MAG: ribosome biogenesis GTPase Der [Actinobacteria bacterium]|nr:ribosome biogenesis GTPase Der [Actinomycetota bacterium]